MSLTFTCSFLVADMANRRIGKTVNRSPHSPSPEYVLYTMSLFCHVLTQLVSRKPKQRKRRVEDVDEEQEVVEQ